MLTFLIMSVIHTMVKIFKIYVYCCLLSAVSIVEMKILNIKGHVGKDVDIKCKQWESWTGVKYNDVKYFCKSPCTEDKHIINKAASGKTTYKRRVELTNSPEGLFVTFKNLQTSDSGTYYCGAEKLFKDSYIKVILSVTYAKSSSPKITPRTVSVGSTLSYPVTNGSTPASSSADIISDVSKSSNTSTSPASATQGAGSVPYLIASAIVTVTILMLILKLMSKMRKHHSKVVSSADTPQQDAQEVAEYDEIRPGDLIDSASLYANYCYNQDPARTANVALNSTSRPEVDSRWACAVSRVVDPQCDLVYSVAQLPRELIEHTEQSEQNQLERNENDSLYSLAQLPEAF